MNPPTTTTALTVLNMITNVELPEVDEEVGVGVVAVGVELAAGADGEVTIDVGEVVAVGVYVGILIGKCVVVSVVVVVGIGVVAVVGLGMVVVATVGVSPCHVGK